MAHKMRQRRCVVASVLSDHPSDDCLAVKPIPFTVPDLLDRFGGVMGAQFLVPVLNTI